MSMSSGQPMVARAGGAAQRRRARRLRSFLPHERMTVRMALAEALHHSCGVEPSGPNEAPRGQKTASAAGMRPDVLAEPGAQGRLVAPSRPGSGGAPSPSLPHLAGGDTMNDSTLSFLVQQAVLAQEKEKDGERASGDV